MNEIKALAASIVHALSQMDVKASPDNVSRISQIHTAVGRIIELAENAEAIAPRDIPEADKA